MKNSYDFLIVGAGIVGLSIARSLKMHRPEAKILIIEKESHEAFHASGRNSGVLHAGFYYTKDSLKAKFCIAGNRAMKEYCRNKNIKLNNCGKLVVAMNEAELETLHELERRGHQNGSNIRLLSEAEAKEMEPHIRTYQKALFSPETSSVNPKEVCQSIKRDLEAQGVEFRFETEYRGHKEDVFQKNREDMTAKTFINCGGLYADKIAHDFGFGKNYRILPFKGIYLKYSKHEPHIRHHIYPVPNINNPFLGVHFTITADGHIKIGPTAIPAFWRENYGGLSRLKIGEMFKILWLEGKLFASNSFGFRDLAFEEMRKYNKKYMARLAQAMIPDVDIDEFKEYTAPGIRAQLLDLKAGKLVSDFVVEGDDKTVHVLNAVSPAFTCAFPFAEHVVENYLKS